MYQYTYDPLNRLVAAVHGEDIKRYRYDELGNRTRQWRGKKYDTYDANPWTTHTYNKRNQLIKTLEPTITNDHEIATTTREYRYDKRGNMTAIIENSQPKTRYTFDATNRMITAVTYGIGTAEYTYNGFMNRVKKLESLNPNQSAAAVPDPCNEIHYSKRH